MCTSAWSVLVLIGSVVLAAQPRTQTERVAEFATASDRSGAFFDTLRRNLRGREPRHWREGWRVAGEIGTAAVPALERIWRDDRNPLRRLAVLAAIDYAAGEHDDFLLARLEKTRETDVQTFVLLCIALGPDRRDTEGVVADFLQRRATKPILRVAACLAGRRLGLRPPDGWFTESEAGVAAAARYCLARADDAGLARWLRRRRPSDTDLVLRGAALGVRQPAQLSTELEDEIVKQLGSGNTSSVVDCAAHAAMRSIDVGALQARGGQIVDPIVPVLAFSPEYRHDLLATLERVVDSSQVEHVVRQRAAVSLALGGSAEQLARFTRKRIARSPDVESAFALAFAYRLFSAPADGLALQNVEPRDRTIAPWIRLARGESVPTASFADPRLTRAFEFARLGELPREACARAIELALWRRGAHPGRAAYDDERAFIHDLLIRGSEYSRHVRGSEPGETVYFPRGLPDSAAMFEVALEYYTFVTTTARRIPDRHRLR